MGWFDAGMTGGVAQSTVCRYAGLHGIDHQSNPTHSFSRVSHVGFWVTGDYDQHDGLDRRLLSSSGDPTDSVGLSHLFSTGFELLHELAEVFDLDTKNGDGRQRDGDVMAVLGDANDLVHDVINVPDLSRVRCFDGVTDFVPEHVPWWCGDCVGHVRLRVSEVVYIVLVLQPTRTTKTGIQDVSL